MKKKHWIHSKKCSLAIRLLFFALVFGGASLSTKAIASPKVTETNQQGSVTVKGTVVDEEGLPLIGASVAQKGTTNGTVTDVDGNFKLTLPAGASFEVSYLGYVSQTINPAGKEEFTIKMIDDSRTLETVVVTALGIKREAKALGYAMTELKGDDLDGNVINPITALQGKAAGVHIAGSDGGMFGSTKIQIRGAATLKGSNQPIYVVDGVILENPTHNNEVDWDSNSNDYGNELKNLNANDFETVSILKGAPATALYGTRGLNGAIVITTKGGKFNQGFGVSINQSFGIETVNTLPNFQTEFGIGRWSSSSLGSRRENPWDTSQFAMLEGRPSFREGGNYWGPRYDGSQIEGYDLEMVAYRPNKNYYKDMFETGTNTNTNVVVRGGGDKATFYNSLGYMNAKGVVKNNDFERLTNMLKGSFKVSDRITVNGSFTFGLSKPKNPQLAIGENTITSSLGPLYDTKKYKTRYKGDFHTGMASDTYGDTYANIPNKGTWWNINENETTRRETSLRPTLDVDVKIQDWVNFKAEASMNYYFVSGETKNLGTGYMNTGTGNGDGGQYKLMREERRQETVAGSFTFNKSFSDFELGGFLRGEYFNSEHQSMSSETDGGLVIPGRFFLDNSRLQKKTWGKWNSKKRILSAVTAANLAWKNQLYLDITGRNDWSSAMIKANGIGNHSFFYPSVSGSWIVTETFKEEMPSIISFAKLRTSWAQVGNDTDAYFLNSAGYGLVAEQQGDGSNINGQKVPDTLIQNNIKPERKNSWEFGADVRLWQDRFSVDFSFYKENTKNQIIELDKAQASGISRYLINAGDIQNKGIELAVGVVPIRTKDWEWDINLTYTRNRSKVIDLHESAGEYLRLAGFANEYNYRIASVAKVGGAYGMLMSDSHPKVNEKTGRKVMTYNSDARVAIYERSGEVQDLGVSINPDFLSSIGTSVRWKNLRFNVLLDMRYGGYMASYSNRYSMAYGLHENSVFGRDKASGGIEYVSIHDGKTYYDGIIPEGEFGKNQQALLPNGTKVNLDGLTYQEAVDKGYLDPQHASTFHRYKGDWGWGTVDDNWFNEVKYIAVRELGLSYAVPKATAARLGLSGLNFGFAARNLGYLYNSLPNNLNPEAIRGTASAEFRERGFTPNRASFTFSVGIDF